MQPRHGGVTVQVDGTDGVPRRAVGQHEVRAVEGPQCSEPIVRSHLGPRLAGGLHEGVERRAGQGAVDGAEEQGSVDLVDQHRESRVPRGAGVLLLEAEVGGVPVVTVGQEAAGGAQEGADPGEHVGVPDRPDALALLAAVEVAPVGLGAGHVGEHLAQLRLAVVHEQDRRRVEIHLVHPVGELAGLLGVDLLVGPDRAVGARRRTASTSRVRRRARGR